MENQIRNVCLSYECPMKWTAMQAVNPTERFCSQCQLVVTDFTNATEKEFTEKLRASTGRICGRFKGSQMSADYLKRIAAAVVMTSAMSCAPEPAIQPNENKTDVVNTVVEEEILLGDVEFSTDSLQEIFTTGIIVTEGYDSLNVDH